MVIHLRQSLGLQKNHGSYLLCKSPIKCNGELQSFPQLYKLNSPGGKLYSLSQTYHLNANCVCVCEGGNNAGDNDRLPPAKYNINKNLRQPAVLILYQLSPNKTSQKAKKEELTGRFHHACPELWLLVERVIVWAAELVNMHTRWSADTAVVADEHIKILEIERSTGVQGDHQPPGYFPKNFTATFQLAINSTPLLH